MTGNHNKGRRSFVNKLLGGFSATIMAGVIYPIIKFLIPPEAPQSDIGAVNAGKLTDYKNNSGKIVKFGNRPAIVLRKPNGDFRAFIAICTHLSCTVQYRSDRTIIWCACHNGVYDLEGINISGPPPRPLAKLQVNFQKDQILISEET